MRFVIENGGADDAAGRCSSCDAILRLGAVVTLSRRFVIASALEKLARVAVVRVRSVGVATPIAV